MQTLNTSAARTQGDIATAEPINLTKRIGSTNYKVSVHFSTTNRETISDKMLRLMKNDAQHIKCDEHLVKSESQFKKAVGE